MSPRFTPRSVLTRPGGAVNEDAAGAGDSWLFVIDGATGLGGEDRMPPDDAAWLARETAAALTARLPDPARSVEDILAETMAALRAAWPGPASDLPSAGLALFRIAGDRLEYFGLGDCDAALLLADGRTLIWREEALARLDRIALEEAARWRARLGCSPREALERIRPTLRRHRALRNRPEGYWCLDPTGAGLPHARRASLPLADCRSLFLCSDGFSQLIGLGEAADLPGLHRQARARGLEPLADRLWALQEADRDLLRLPRFKLRDDASAVLAEAAF